MAIRTVLKSESLNNIAWRFWDLNIHDRRSFERQRKCAKFSLGARVTWKPRDNENKSTKIESPARLT